jgi:hypothetical protein
MQEIEIIGIAISNDFCGQLTDARHLEPEKSVQPEEVVAVHSKWRDLIVRNGPLFESKKRFESKIAFMIKLNRDPRSRHTQRGPLEK